MNNRYILTLKKGDLIALTDFHNEDETPPTYEELMMGGQRRARTQFDGKPWRIVSISLPFLLVTDGKKRVSIDTRMWSVQRVSKEYAREWRSEEQTTETLKKGKKTNDLFKKKPRKEKPGLDQCTKCGGKMKQALKGHQVWKWVCSECGNEGPDVDKIGIDK